MAKPRDLAMTPAAELTAVQSAARALSALPPSAPAASLRAALRAVDRAADDAEAAADEADGGAAAALAAAVADARGAAALARDAAQCAAREELRAGRRLLLDGGDAGRGDGGTGAAKVAEDINAGLRRATGIVQEELDRTRATGDVGSGEARRGSTVPACAAGR